MTHSFAPPNFTLPDVATLTQKQVIGAAIHEFNGEWYIRGKYADACLESDGRWNVWIVNTDDPTDGLSRRKLSHLLTKLNREPAALRGPLKRLSGEAVYISMATDCLLKNLKLLGIRLRHGAGGNDA